MKTRRALGPLLAAIGLPIFGAAFLPDRLGAAGWVWDALNAIGLAGLVLLVVLAWLSESPARPPGLRVHQSLAIVTTALVTAHAAGFLLADPLTLEYLIPTAPGYMLVGVLGYLLLLALTITSFPTPRRRLYRRFQHFRRWHLVLSVALLVTALWHVLGTDYLFRGVARGAALVLLAVGLPAFVLLNRDRSRAYALLGALAIGLLVVVVALGIGALQERLRAQAPMLPVTFAHATHTTVNCITCHHNFIDESGQGLCFDCHLNHPDVRALREVQFHALCRDCHVEKQALGEDGGPLRACADCHTADEEP